MSWKERIAAAKEALWVIALVSPVVSFIGVIFVAGLIGIYGDRVIEWAQGAFGIAENRELVLQALGEDRVIRQPLGLSYVGEPVATTDSEVLLVVSFARTTFGRSCDFTGGHAMFAGRDGVPRLGERLTPIEQISNDLVTFELWIDKPDRLPVGRAVAYLIMDYTCHRDGEQIQVPDRTYNMPFIHALR